MDWEGMSPQDTECNKPNDLTSTHQWDTSNTKYHRRYFGTVPVNTHCMILDPKEIEPFQSDNSSTQTGLHHLEKSPDCKLSYTGDSRSTLEGTGLAQRIANSIVGRKHLQLE